MPNSKVEVVADSVNILTCSRLTTFRLTFPRTILAQFNTHRMFSRNAASTRAIPINKVIQQVLDDPYIPSYWGKNQPGMVASEEIPEENKQKAIDRFLRLRSEVVEGVRELQALGAAKQTANQLLTPWMFTTVVVSATSWTNFFTLRCHPHAQPEFRELAEHMREVMQSSVPVWRNDRTMLDPRDAWHLPFITDLERKTSPLEDLLCMSVARCARVSYHRSGEVKDLEEDRALYNRLAENGHLSPFEHPALASFTMQSGNFRGWEQYRIHKFGYTY